jgi:hypothetical protein
MQGRIIEMYIARRKDAAVEAVPRARLLPGQGIAGDRYFRARQESLFAGEARSHSQGASHSQESFPQSGELPRVRRLPRVSARKTSP